MMVQLPLEIRMEHGTTSAGWNYTIEEAFPMGAAVNAEPLWVLCRDHGGCTTVIQLNDDGRWERWLVEAGVILTDDPEFRTALEPGELLPWAVVDGVAVWCERESRVLMTSFDPVRSQLEEVAVE